MGAPRVSLSTHGCPQGAPQHPWVPPGRPPAPMGAPRTAPSTHGCPQEGPQHPWVPPTSVQSPLGAKSSRSEAEAAALSQNPPVSPRKRRFFFLKMFIFLHGAPFWGQKAPDPSTRPLLHEFFWGAINPRAPAPGLRFFLLFINYYFFHLHFWGEKARFSGRHLHDGGRKRRFFDGLPPKNAVFAPNSAAASGCFLH